MPSLENAKVSDFRKKSSSRGKRTSPRALEALWYLNSLKSEDANREWLNDRISRSEKHRELKETTRKLHGRSPMKALEDMYVLPYFQSRFGPLGVAGRGWSGVVLTSKKKPHRVLKITFDDPSEEIALQTVAHRAGAALAVKEFRRGKLDGRDLYNIELESISGSLKSLLSGTHAFENCHPDYRRRFHSDGIALGTAVVELLKKLHRADLKHGDLHLDNIAYVVDEKNPCEYSLALIDFGNARRLSTRKKRKGFSSDAKKLLLFLDKVPTDGATVADFLKDIKEPVRHYAESLETQRLDRARASGLSLPPAKRRMIDG